jgi:hypothetical protein
VHLPGVDADEAEAADALTGLDRLEEERVLRAAGELQERGDWRLRVAWQDDA